MRTIFATGLLVPMLPLAALGATGCDDKEADGAEPGPVIGVMEMPISLRNGDAKPTNSVSVEIGPNALGLGGKKVIDLTSGKLPEAERTGAEIKSLASQISGATAATIRLHVNTPYDTLARTLGTLKAKGIGQVGFEVRKGPGAETGYLVASQYEVAKPRKEPAVFGGSAQRSWEEVAPVWEAMYGACREAHYVDCDFKPQNIAEGGDLQISLFARGKALKLELLRFGVLDAEEDEKKPGGPALIEGVAPAPSGEEPELPPATDATFTWRFEAATAEASPISGAMKPLCGAKPCAILVTGDKETLSMRVVSFLGAAFPDGASSPFIRFEVPE